jgi:uncharacterized membrane protein
MSRDGLDVDPGSAAEAMTTSLNRGGRVKDALKHVLAGLVLIVVFAAVTVAVMVYGFGVGLLGSKLDRPLENARTDVTRSTNQYVTTQQLLLLQYAKEYRAAEADGAGGQMRAILAQMRAVASTLDQDRIPDIAQEILSQNP